MIINDLVYLEMLALDSTLKGGASLAMDATAFAAGNTTYALTDTDVLLRTVPSGKVTIDRGQGYALAIGDIHYTNVDYAADGFDKVIVKRRSRQTIKWLKHKNQNFGSGSPSLNHFHKTHEL